MFPSVLIAGPARLHEARVLRCRARGGGPGRRPSLSLTARPPRRRGPPRRLVAGHDLLQPDRGEPPQSFLLALARRASLLGAARLRDRLRARPASAAAASSHAASPSCFGGLLARRLLLRRRHARARGVGREGGRRDDAPQLMNVVRELAIAAEHPDAEGLHHRRHRAQRLRHRARPEARVGRDHHRPAREAQPRGAPGRHRPRAVARPQLRHPVLAARRRARRRDRAALGLLPALHVLGRRPAARRDRDSGGGGLQAIMFVVAIVLPILAPIAPGSSSWRSAASASTSPTRRRSS